MQLKKRLPTKSMHKVAVRHNDDVHHHRCCDEAGAESQQPRGLNASVRFFVDHIIGVAVSSVARRQASSARLAISGSNGTVLHIFISTVGEGDSFKFVAHSNDMCMFVGASASLYVVDQTARELEQSIYLYISERLDGEQSIRAQIFRDSGTLFDLPILEGSSDAGPRSLLPRAVVVNG